MPGFWKLNYEGGSIEDKGIAVRKSQSWYLSPISVLSFGFMYGVGDTWFNLDDTIIQNVTWTPCDCSECD